MSTKSMERKMKKSALMIALVVTLTMLLGIYQIASAHQTITVGDYDVEYGWVNEPAIVGQPNDVVINITPTSGSGADIDVSALTIQAVYGGQTKTLTLQPLGENTPRQFIAPMTPMRPGQYTIHLGGSIGSTSFNTDVVPEEVMTADLVQFPADAGQATSTSGVTFGLSGWLGMAGIVLGALGTVLGLVALARQPAKS
jgi:hypothetical protein